MKVAAMRFVVAAIVGALAGLAIWVRIGSLSRAEPLQVIAASAVIFSSVYFVWTVSWRQRGERPENQVARWNRNAHSLLGWILLAMANLLAIGYLAKPAMPYRPADLDELGAAVLSHVLSQFPTREIIYIRFESKTDPPAKVLSQLGAQYPTLRLAPWSARPQHDDGCQAVEGTFPVGSCGKDNFVAVSSVSLVFWHVAVVDLQTQACRGSAVVFRGMSSWHVISSRWQICV